MTCPDCQGEDPDCFRCNGDGEICNHCGKALSACQCELDEDEETLSHEGEED